MTTTALQQQDKAHILQAIDLVKSKCEDSQARLPDVLVGQVIQGLQTVRALVRQQWPLPESVKAQLNFGPVAAKNIADWNDELATSLMIIQHVLKYDGDSVYKLLESPEL